MTCRRIAEPVSHPRLRQNIFRPGGIVFDLLTKVPDIRSQVLALAAMRTPNTVYDLRVCQSDVLTLHQKREQLELPPGEATSWPAFQSERRLRSIFKSPACKIAGSSLRPVCIRRRIAARR